MMEIDASDEVGAAVAGLIVADGAGRYFAIAWDDLRRFRVPAAWMATVDALVRGAEPVVPADDLGGYADVLALPGALGLLNETVAEADGFRFATQRLEAWALLR
jgi:hypothetical protein